MDGPEDDQLTASDDAEEGEVEDGEDSEGVALAGERPTGDGQREAGPRLAVESPVAGRWQERDRGQQHAQHPARAARRHGGHFGHVQAGVQREAQG